MLKFKEKYLKILHFQGGTHSLPCKRSKQAKNRESSTQSKPSFKTRKKNSKLRGDELISKKGKYLLILLSQFKSMKATITFTRLDINNPRIFCDNKITPVYKNHLSHNK